jgi:signal transduction histidine kinase
MALFVNSPVGIRDMGSRISRENFDRIFEPSFTTKPRKGDEEAGEPVGTELGLYPCVQLLEFYRGEIGVEDREGDGPPGKSPKTVWPWTRSG